MYVHGAHSLTFQAYNLLTLELYEHMAYKMY